MSQQSKISCRREPSSRDSSNSELSPKRRTVTADAHPQRVHPHEGFHSATRATARLLVGTVLLLAMISTLAQLAGCNVTRAIPTAQAAPSLQPIDCGTWVDCA